MNLCQNGRYTSKQFFENGHGAQKKKNGYVGLHDNRNSYAIAFGPGSVYVQGHLRSFSACNALTERWPLTQKSLATEQIGIKFVTQGY